LCTAQSRSAQIVLGYGVLNPIPLIRAGGPLDLVESRTAEARDLLATALAAHPLLPSAARVGDLVAKAWLRRQASPYHHEIDAVARIVARPGVHFLNLVYEIACSTSGGLGPSGGNRMVRVLDWGMHGIGRFLVAVHRTSVAGEWFDVTWPGYVGVLTAMAPRRFAGAINQAPRLTPTGIRPLDEIVARVGLAGARGTIPASHLLRRVFEAAPDYRSAVMMLADETVTVAKPAIFCLTGLAPGECAVVEAMGTKRRVHEEGNIAVANAWINDDWPGVPRLHAAVARAGETPLGNNIERRRDVAALARSEFRGVADLQPPVLNRHTVLVAMMEPGSGALKVEALDFASPGDAFPSVVAGPLEFAPQRPAESVRRTASLQPS
jgi:hypothetical protein